MALTLTAKHEGGFYGDATTNWQTALQIPATRLQGSSKYLLLVTCGITHTEGGEVQLQVTQDETTPLTGSVARCTPLIDANGTRAAPYSYMTVVTMPGTATSLDLQVKNVVAAAADNAIHTIDASIVVFCLDDLVEGTDYFFTEDTTATTLNLLSGDDKLAINWDTFITVTMDDPPPIKYWLIFAHVNWTATATGQTTAFALVPENNNISDTYSNIRLPPIAKVTAHTENDQYSFLAVLGSDTNTNVNGMHDQRLLGIDYSPFAAHSTYNSGRMFGLLEQDDVSDFGPPAPYLFLEPVTPNWLYLVPTQPQHTLDWQFMPVNKLINIYSAPVHALQILVASDIGSNTYAGKTRIVSGYRDYPTGIGTDSGVVPPGFDHVLAVRAAEGDYLPAVRLSTTILQPRPPAGDSYYYLRSDHAVDNVSTITYADWTSYCLLSVAAINTDGVGELVFPAFQLTGTGTFVKPAVTGDSSLDLPSFTFNGTGTFASPYVGRHETIELSGLQITGTGTFSMPTFTGAGAMQFPGMTVAGEATYAILPITTTAELLFSPLVLSGDGSFIPKPCDAFAYGERGRLPISVDQELQYGTNYPFVAPSADTRYLLADLYLAYDDPADYLEGHELEVPFHVAWFFGYGCVHNSRPDFVTAGVFHAADIVIQDAAGRTVFDSTTATTYREQLWGSHLRIHEWVTSRGVCRVVVHLKWSDGTQPTPRNYDTHLLPTNGVLDARTLHRMPNRVRKLIIDDQSLAGEISLYNGYNTTLEDQGQLSDPSPLATVLGESLGASTDGTRAGHRLALGGEAGTGLGRAPGCNDLLLNILKVNGSAPDAYGNLRLQADQCYWFEQPADRNNTPAEMTPATLEFHNDCVPCCTCDDFVQVKLGIDSLYDRWKTVADDAMAVRDQYAANITRWDDQKACRANKNQRLVLTSNCVGYIGIGYTYCSNATECSGPLEVHFDFLANAAPRASNEGVTGTEGFQDETVINGNFSQGDASWDGTGAFEIPDTNGHAIIGRDTWQVADNLLANGLFTTDTASWISSGYAHHIDLPGVVLGDPAGGIGRLRQTVTVESGETYRARLFVHSSSGTNRIVLSAGSGTILSVTAIPAGLVDEYVEATAVATDSQIVVSIEAEVAAADTVTVREVLLEPWSGTLSQHIHGLSAGQTYRLKVVLWDSKGTPSCTVTDSENVAIVDIALPTNVNPYKVVSQTFTATSDEVTIKCTSHAGPPDILKLVGVSLQQLVLDGGSPASGPSSGDNSDGMSLVYVPDSARKNDVTSQRLKAYEMSGSYPNLVATWDRLNPGKSAKMAFLLFSCASADGDSVTVTATPYLHGVKQQEITETVAASNACSTRDELCNNGT